MKPFIDSLRNAAQTTEIYGECGGYMVLGETLTDADGTRHNMAGLLPLETSFAERRLHLGYRRLRGYDGQKARDIGVVGQFTAHEFHYATTPARRGRTSVASRGRRRHRLAAHWGLVNGNVSGSFAHIIDVC